MNRDTLHMLNRVQSLGISLDDALALRRISMTLHRWYELECGDSNEFASWSVERDPDTDLPYRVTHSYRYMKCLRTRIADRERGALRRLDTLMARYPDLTAYVQTDPRGHALYVYRKADLDGRDIDCCYSSVGTAVFK